ncbi:MAG: hypothetical protein RMA76_13910 [Deltaproteobacteria bacterium]|jgi:hypothetical protein
MPTKLNALMTLGLVAALSVPAYAGDGKNTAPTSISLQSLEAEHQRENEAFLEKLKKRKVPAPVMHRHFVPGRHDLKLVSRENKVRAELLALEDGRVIYIVDGDVDRKRYRQMRDIPKTAIRVAVMQNGVEPLARGKVGQVVTLYLRNDAKGFAYVTQITR